MIDRWGAEVAGDAASVAAWNDAWGQFMSFTGAPIATLTDATEHDDDFVMGPVFIALYSVLGGQPLDAPVVVDNVERIRQRTAADDSAHRPAIDDLAAGNFTRAADGWARLGAHSEDFTSHRFAHDLYLHVGAWNQRLSWSRETLDHWRRSPVPSYVDGMHAFTANEAALFHEADVFGRFALRADATDMWARHALAHVYEDTDDTAAAMQLLSGDEGTLGARERALHAPWSEQDMLATHVWWHLALRLLAAGDVEQVLAVADDIAAVERGAFGLCDQTSLLWRIELAGHDVGGRWDQLADDWDARVERHTCGFLDLHATLTFLRRPDHRGAERWFAGLDARPSGPSELDEIFDEVVKPLVTAFRARDAGDTEMFHATLDRLGDETARIGGSNAQRQIITLTREATPT